MRLRPLHRVPLQRRLHLQLPQLIQQVQPLRRLQPLSDERSARTDWAFPLLFKEILS